MLDSPNAAATRICSGWASVHSCCSTFCGSSQSGLRPAACVWTFALTRATRLEATAKCSHHRHRPTPGELRAGGASLASYYSRRQHVAFGLLSRFFLPSNDRVINVVAVMLIVMYNAGIYYTYICCLWSCIILLSVAHSSHSNSHSHAAFTRGPVLFTPGVVRDIRTIRI
jgi:hypothetical protein